MPAYFHLHSASANQRLAKPLHHWHRGCSCAIALLATFHTLHLLGMWWNTVSGAGDTHGAMIALLLMLLVILLLYWNSNQVADLHAHIDHLTSALARTATDRGAPATTPSATTSTAVSITFENGAGGSKKRRARRGRALASVSKGSGAPFQPKAAVTEHADASNPGWGDSWSE